MRAKPTCSNAPRIAGFTLVEMVIVVLVIGMMAGAAAPRFLDTLANNRVEAAAKRIAVDLNYARAHAISKGSSTDEQIHFFTATEKYELAGLPDPDHPGASYWVDFSTAGYPVDLVSVTFTNDQSVTTNQTLQYNLYGRPRSGSGTISALTTGQIVVSSGSHQRTVVINAVTGKASVQ